MNTKRYLENFVRGWLPEENAMPVYQQTKISNCLKQIQLLRIFYGLMFCSMLVTPFGVYHSISEPYISGFLWGYNLPIGYAGPLLGLTVVFYPQLKVFRSLKFSSLMLLTGLLLLTTFWASPNTTLINLFHGTNFSATQIDVDAPVGNAAVMGLALLSITLGLASRTKKQFDSLTSPKTQK